VDQQKSRWQRIGNQILMRSQGMTDGENRRDLPTRLSAALAMTENRVPRGQASEGSLASQRD
jgi:hypothetical protein